MVSKYFTYPKDMPQGRKTLTVEKIYGAKPEDATIGLHLSPEMGVRLAVSIIFAAYNGKSLDLKVVKKPRPDGKYSMTVTIP